MHKPQTAESLSRKNEAEFVPADLDDLRVSNRLRIMPHCSPLRKEIAEEKIARNGERERTC